MIIAAKIIYFLSTPPQNYLFPVQFSPHPALRTLEGLYDGPAAVQLHGGAVLRTGRAAASGSYSGPAGLLDPASSEATCLLGGR